MQPIVSQNVLEKENEPITLDKRYELAKQQ
jgi:hypothetical protein